METGGTGQVGGDVMLGTGQMGRDVMLGSRCVDRTAGVGVDHVEVLYGFLGTTGQLGGMLGSRGYHWTDLHLHWTVDHVGVLY